ncbi:SH3 domain-containing protein [Rhizobium wenxiniae]|uniref:SH3 domain-containing protein n=1 Tax=Rhizobium wenxiniae TaxID=1737357 RepID=UPI003C14E416
MTTPYRNFWIIIGMTAGAVILANLSAKPKTSSRSKSATYETARPTTTPSPDWEKATQHPGSTQSSAGRSNSDATEAPSGVTPSTTQPAGREFRSIDEDIKKAFDVAMQTALAGNSIGTSSATSQTEPASPELPALVTKEIKDRPEVVIASPLDRPLDAAASGKPAKTKTNLNMREGPGPKYLLVETLPTGAPVLILEEEAGWVHIRVTETGRDGWVNPTYLERR